MLEACSTPDLITEFTLQPLRRYDVDAAILFSDIVVPLRAVGVDIDIRPGVGPVVDEPDPRPRPTCASCAPLEAGDIPFVTEAVTSLVTELGGKPLIGFAGGPFTLACYLVDGGPSKNFELTKSLMYGQPRLWDGAAEPAGRHHDRASCGSRSRPGRRRSSCSTPGSGRSARRTTGPGAAAQRPGVRGAGRDRRAADPLRRGHRRAARRCWARPVPTWSASTGGCRWTRRPAGSAPARHCRATWTRPSCWRRGR